MTLPRLLLLVALFGLVGAVLVWFALALVYGPEAAMVLRVVGSAAVAGVGVLRLRGFDRNGEAVEVVADVEPDTFASGPEAEPGPASGMLAGDPRPCPKRPGQWGRRARMLRARRLDRAEERRDREWMRRARGRQQAVLGGRRGKRALDRLCLEGRARSLGIALLPGEFTAALWERVARARLRATTPRGLMRAELAELSGGVVEVDNATATVRITMPAGTSAERCEEVRADIVTRLSDFVCLEVAPAADLGAA